MTTIPIYDKDGKEVDKITLKDTITPVNGRVSKGKKNYYKGLGVNYRCHVLGPDVKDLTGYKVLENPNVFYMGPLVSKSCFENKYGIFQEKYQPQFTDFIGSCGVKELSIIENSTEFAKSSVEVIKSVNYDKKNGQYYFVLNYKCDRIKYLDKGDPIALYSLLEYMIKEDWNFIWDKTSIEDISYNGMVSDVADIFKSSSLMNKMGTVYSVLYSLGNISLTKYVEFNRIHNLEHKNQMSYTLNAAKLLQRFGVDTREMFISNDEKKNFENIVLNYIINGRNCGDCCYIELGDKIREQYITQTRKQLGV